MGLWTHQTWKLSVPLHYQAINLLTNRLDWLDSRLGTLKSGPTPPTASPKTPSPARGPHAAHSKSMKSKVPAPTTPSTMKAPALLLSAWSLLKSSKRRSQSLCLSWMPRQATLLDAWGLAYARFMTSHMPNCWYPPPSSLVHMLSLSEVPASSWEIGDAITDIRKCLACCWLCTPRSTKKKTNPTLPVRATLHWPDQTSRDQKLVILASINNYYSSPSKDLKRKGWGSLLGEEIYSEQVSYRVKTN